MVLETALLLILLERIKRPFVAVWLKLLDYRTVPCFHLLVRRATELAVCWLLAFLAGRVVAKRSFHHRHRWFGRGYVPRRRSAEKLLSAHIQMLPELDCLAYATASTALLPSLYRALGWSVACALVQGRWR